MELYSLLPGESIEVRAIPPSGEHRIQRFVGSWVDLYEEAAKLDVDYNVYFGVAPRVIGPDGKLRGTNANVPRVPVLWLDADAKGEHTKDSRRVQLEPWKPTWLVDSGQGLHAYWRLEEDVRPVQAQKFLKAFARQLDCDDTSDPARILRVPGTRNYKCDPPRFIDVIANSGPSHYLADLSGRLIVPIEADVPAPPNHARRIELLQQHGMTKGGKTLEGEHFEGRDASVFEAACFWRDENKPRDEVIELCRNLNAMFSPPLPMTDIERKVESAFTREAPPVIAEVIEAPVTSSSTAPVTRFTVQSMADIMAFQEPATEWIANGVLARGHIVYTMNPPKSGKTTVALNLGIRMAGGKSGAGLFVDRPYRVLFLQPMGDMHPSLTREWSRKIMAGLSLDESIPFHIAVMGERHEHFKYLFDEAGGYDLIIVDTISRLFPAVDDADTRTVSEELDKIRRLRMMYPQACWLYLVQVGKNSLAHLKGATPGFAARGNSAIAEVFDDALQIIVPNNDIERDEELGLNLTRHIVMMGRGAASYRRPWRTRFHPETHVVEWVQDLTYDEAVEATTSTTSSQPTQTRQAADLLGRLFLDAQDATGQRGVLASEVYRVGEENGFSKRVMRLALDSRGGIIDPSRGPKSMWWDCQIEVVE